MKEIHIQHFHNNALHTVTLQKYTKHGYEFKMYKLTHTKQSRGDEENPPELDMRIISLRDRV